MTPICDLLSQNWETSRKRQAADFKLSTNQHCRVFIVSDIHPDQYFQFVKDILL